MMPRQMKPRPLKRSPLWLALCVLLASGPCMAARPVFKLEIRNHLFIPDRIVIPANTRVRLLIQNHDPGSEEFESYELNREKVIGANHKASIFIGPLPAGSYPFFGEFNPETARGQIIVE